MNMKYTITASLLSFVALLNTSYGVQMTPQISSLLEQKNAKIAELEKCDSNRKAWMIAGVSTIGLTAVGVGVNIAQAQKSKNLSAEINRAKSELGNQQLFINTDRGCYYGIDGNKPDNDLVGLISGCSKPGDWGVEFDYGTFYGIAACSDLAPSGSSEYEIATDQNVVQSAYSANVIKEPKGKYCYCKANNPDARWVFEYEESTVAECSSDCARWCARDVAKEVVFRKLVLGK